MIYRFEIRATSDSPLKEFLSYLSKDWEIESQGRFRAHETRSFSKSGLPKERWVRIRIKAPDEPGTDSRILTQLLQVLDALHLGSLCDVIRLTPLEED